MDQWEKNLREKMARMRLQADQDDAGAYVIDADEEVPAQADPEYAQQAQQAPAAPQSAFERWWKSTEGWQPKRPSELLGTDAAGYVQKHLTPEQDEALWGAAQAITETRQANEQKYAPLGHDAALADNYPRAYQAGLKVMDGLGIRDRIKQHHAEQERTEASEEKQKEVLAQSMVNEEIARRAVAKLKKEQQRAKLEKDRDEAGARYRIERPIYQSEKKK